MYINLFCATLIFVNVRVYYFVAENSCFIQSVFLVCIDSRITTSPSSETQTGFGNPVNRPRTWRTTSVFRGAISVACHTAARVLCGTPRYSRHDRNAFLLTDAKVLKQAGKGGGILVTDAAASLSDFKPTVFLCRK